MQTKIGQGELSSPEASAATKTSLVGLVRSLTSEIRIFLRQEIDLAKAEAVEKLTWLIRNVIVLAAGGFVAYAGLIVLLIGMGWLVAWALQKAGVQPVLAGFIGLAIIGVLTTAVGAIFVLNGVKRLFSDSLAPKRTIQTIRRLKGAEHQGVAVAEKPKPAPRPSSEEMQNRVEATENRMSETLDELGQRLSPRRINERMKQRIQENPYRSGLLAVGMGLLGGLFLAREFRRS